MNGKCINLKNCFDIALHIKVGKPYPEGYEFKILDLLSENITVKIGRKNQDFEPHIPFNEIAEIARNHASIFYDSNSEKVLIKNHTSQGTIVDKHLLKEEETAELAHDSKIVLINEEKVKMVFRVNEGTIHVDSYIYLDRAEKEVKINKDLIKLAPQLFYLFELMMENKGKTVSYEKIIKTLWRVSKDCPKTKPDVCNVVERLRNELAEKGYSSIIQTVRSNPGEDGGYKLVI